MSVWDYFLIVYFLYKLDEIYISLEGINKTLTIIGNNEVAVQLSTNPTKESKINA